MEEARAKMLGNSSAVPRIRVIASDSERSMSLDSLNMHELTTNKYHSLGDISTGSDSVFISECSSRRPSLKASDFDTAVPSPYLTADYNGVSSASIFAQSVLSGYLQSHRQSISAAIEAISFLESPDKTPVPSDDEYFDTLPDEDPDDEDGSTTPVNGDEIEPNPPRLEVPRHLNFATMLSPIQENGETPTSESGTIEQSVSKYATDHSSTSFHDSTPDLISASSMEELKEFLMLETLCTSYQWMHVYSCINTNELFAWCGPPFCYAHVLVQLAPITRHFDESNSFRLLFSFASAADLYGRNEGC